MAHFRGCREEQIVPGRAARAIRHGMLVEFLEWLVSIVEISMTARQRTTAGASSQQRKKATRPLRRVAELNLFNSFGRSHQKVPFRILCAERSVSPVDSSEKYQATKVPLGIKIFARVKSLCIAAQAMYSPAP